VATNGPIVHPTCDIYIYEHGEPWWNDVSKGKLLIHPPELSGNPTSSHLIVNQEELGEGDEFGLMEASSFILQSDFLCSVKYCDMGLTALLFLKRKACCRYLSL
jgi:hypothetical protein